MKRERKPWMKFYPQDWLGDPGLRACSAAARGVWMDLISIAHEADPYGHILINGCIPTNLTLARMTATDVETFDSALSELDKNGVFSRTGRGEIYSRRMCADEKRSRLGKENIQNRWEKGEKPAVKTRKKDVSKNGYDNDNAIKNVGANTKHHTKGTEKFTNSVIPRVQSPESRKKDYVFEAQIIKLKKADFDGWESSFSEITDLRAELQSLDAYLVKKKIKAGWFVAASNMLRKKHERLLIERRASGNPAYVPDKTEKAQIAKIKAEVAANGGPFDEG